MTVYGDYRCQRGRDAAEARMKQASTIEEKEKWQKIRATWISRLKAVQQ